MKLFHRPSVGVNRGRYIGLISAEIEFLSLHGDTQVPDYRGLTFKFGIRSEYSEGFGKFVYAPHSYGTQRHVR